MKCFRYKRLGGHKKLDQLRHFLYIISFPIILLMMLYFLQDDTKKQRMSFHPVEEGVTKLTMNEKTALRQIVVNYSSIIHGNATSFPFNTETGLTFPINIPNACGSGTVTVFMPVHSAITNFERRQIMRGESQGEYLKNNRNDAILIFFVGFPSENEYSKNEIIKIQNSLLEESDKYRDIIQLNIEDIYHGIVRKAVGVLYWISQYCTNSEFVVKMDDDIRVNMARLVASLRKTKRKQDDFIMGERRDRRHPHRDKNSKYYISKDDYPFSTWPPYVPGGLIGYPMSTAIKLYRQAIQLKPIWLDDVFISGICAQKLGIPIVTDVDFRFDHGRTKT